MRHIILSLILCIIFIELDAQKEKICVASDLHYFDPALLINDGPAFHQYIMDDRKLIKESSAIVKSLFKSIIEEKPDILLIPGDLTKDGELVSHQNLAQLTYTINTKLTSPPYSLSERQAKEIVPHCVKAMIAHYCGDEKIPDEENAFIYTLLSSKDSILVKLGNNLRYLWTDLMPADNNVTLNLKSGSISDLIR